MVPSIQYTMLRRAVKILKYVCISLGLNLLILQNIALAHEASTYNNEVSSVAQEGASSLQDGLLESVEQNFDKIRKYQSYDPATDKWSSIEDFGTVEILEDTTQQREDRYIYYSFWAYDAAKKRWYKVDIRDYGYLYRLGIKRPTSATDQSGTEPAEKKARDSSWKNLELSFSLGGGATFYNNAISNLQLIERDGDYFLQAKDDEPKDEAYFVRWFRDSYEKKKNFFRRSVAYTSGVVKRVSSDRKFSFKGSGVNIPITLALHYNFFKRLRIGAGSNIEVSHLKKLAPTGNASHTSAMILQEPWLYNIKWFGLVGFKIVRRPTKAMIIDTQIGHVYDAGSRLKILLNKRGEYLYTNWYINIGLGYEKKLNNYLKLKTRLSVDHKSYKDTASFPSSSSVAFIQPAIHLEGGITFNCAKDSEWNETKVEELEQRS